MTEVKEYGTHIGRVIRFFNRKGYGFINDLTDNNDYFVHNTEIQCKEGVFRKLYPGEYVSYNLVERQGKMNCSNIRGIMGNPLLIENEEHSYRVYPKEAYREWSYNQDNNISCDNTSESDDDTKDEGVEEEGVEDEVEIINKEAPEGLEVAEFEGLNINEEMS